MNHRCSIFTVLSALFFAGLSPAAPVGEFDDHGDIGAPQLPGTASYDPVNQEYTLSGAGTNMWLGADQFQFAWKKMSGDFILRTRVEFIGKGAVEHRKIGWLVRPSLDPDAPYADCAEHGSGLTSLQFRRARGANTEELALSVTNADVLQFERRGTTFIFSAAHYGEPFVNVQLGDLDLGAEVLAGLFICSHSAEVVEQAVFRDVRIVVPPRPDFTPYRDYLGSVLEILDVQSGRLQKIYSSPRPFEAPNWTRDGKALIYNLSGRVPDHGRLIRFDLATKETSFLPSGSATNNNNDHVLSFDGTRLGFSGAGAHSGGQSQVWTLPSAGGEPTLITPQAPSYLHGWSPDGQWLVFTGGRSNKFDIYKIPAGGGEEIRLTDAPGLNDGPEYSPDGKYIYFNSSRTGKMQIWRMRPDGSAQERVTNDDLNDWFPHVSPDGKWIAFLSFGDDVKPDDHPYYKTVYLRLMPAEGGEAKVIAYVFGGQGTMNVPSWSPDSRHLAFVSNTQLP
jgi:Tol biopolymer transport system component